MSFLRSAFGRCFWLAWASAEKLSFNRDVRPILSENCFYCHGVDGNKRKADLRLDVRADALRSDAFVPGDLNASELFHRIHSTDEDEVMPPPESNRILTSEQKNILERWIKEGAEYEKHWAFVAGQKGPSTGQASRMGSQPDRSLCSFQAR